jgi:hypothetical protein
MRQVTATEKYKAVNEGKMAKGEFVRQMRLAYPTLITQFNGYSDTVQILKNKGLVFEVQEEQHNFSDEAVRRGVDIELSVLGLDPANCFDEEAINKAKSKTLANLKKDPLFYINLLSNESSKVDKHDKYQEVKKTNHKDTFNDMKKASLKEGTLKEEMINVINLLKKERAASNDEIKEFLKTHSNDIKGMTPKDIVEEFDNFISVNYESPSDFMQQEIGGVDRFGHKVEDEDEISTLSKAKETIWGMREGFKPGDTWSKDFDYKGMLKFALTVDAGTPIDVLKKLYSSFEDVNYHTENEFLGNAIAALESNDQDEFVQNIEAFKDAITNTIKGLVAEGGGFERKSQVTEALGSELSAEDLSDLAQFFYNYAIQTEMDEYTEVAEHLDQASRVLAQIEAPSKGPGMSEKKGKDLDGDGDIDGDDYMHAKDKAIKSAMGKEDNLKEAIKSIIQKVLAEDVINEAATAELARIGEDYSDFQGMKSAINALENIVTDIESYYDKTRQKIQKIYDDLAELRNEEGLKVGGFLAPSIEAAFLKDLRPVTKLGFTNGLQQPKVRAISQADIDAHNSGERPLGETDMEAPKQTVFTPVMESKRKSKK